MAKGPSSPQPSALGLKRIRLFEGLELSRIEELAKQCRWRRFSPDEHIISREAPDTDVYFVISGRVCVKAFSASGRQVTFREIAPGDWFGDFAAIDGLTRSADVIAIDETLVAGMSPSLFLRTLHENVEVADRMLRHLVRMVRELTERIYDFSTLGVQNRVHAEILRLAREAGIEGNRALIDPAPKHSDIAGHISTYREQVSRELSAMVKQGLIEKSGRALVVPDVAKLQRMVEDVRRSA